MGFAAIATTTTATSAPPQRMKAVDGLRGLSIILVLLYHAYSRWADLLPWTAQYRYFIVFEHGGLGVNLFFIISGFVIFMTLHNCETFWEFIYRRWLRLFPAMCLATVLIYASSEWLSERPVGALTVADTLPGLLFIDPFILNKLLPFHSKVIEGAFWSIFVEVKFYLIFGALYFAHRTRALLYLAILFFGTLLCVDTFPFSLGISESVALVLKKILSLHHMGWFVIGALLYQAYLTRSVRSLVASACILPFAAVADSGKSVEIVVVCAALYGVFVAALFNTAAQRLFSSRFFLLWGFISYPLYLIHQNMTVALTIKTHKHFPELPGLLTPIPGLTAIVMISYLMARYGEPLLRRWVIRIGGPSNPYAPDSSRPTIR